MKIKQNIKLVFNKETELIDWVNEIMTQSTYFMSLKGGRRSRAIENYNGYSSWVLLIVFCKYGVEMLDVLAVIGYFMGTK